LFSKYRCSQGDEGALGPPGKPGNYGALGLLGESGTKGEIGAQGDPVRITVIVTTPLRYLYIAYTFIYLLFFIRRHWASSV